MNKIKLILIISLLLLTLSLQCFAHKGGTDGAGGHYDSSIGKYHYHHSYPAHQHTNGECPYEFKNNEKQNNNSRTVKNNTATTNAELTTSVSTKTKSFNIFINENALPIFCSLIILSFLALFISTFFDVGLKAKKRNKYNISKENIIEIPDKCKPIENKFEGITICYQANKPNEKAKELFKTEQQYKYTSLSKSELRAIIFDDSVQIKNAHSILLGMLKDFNPLHVSYNDIKKIAIHLQKMYPEFDNINELTNVIYKTLSQYSIITSSTGGFYKYSFYPNLISDLSTIAYNKKPSVYSVFFPYHLFEAFFNLFYDEILEVSEDVKCCEDNLQDYLRLIKQVNIRFSLK